jgi:death-on-curing protein
VKEPVWVREIEALAFHTHQIALFGGSDGVRDRGLLDSALARPKNLFAYAERVLTMADLAAPYAFGICSNHPFVDGNKRTAMEVAFVFLEFNGIAMTVSQEEACVTFLRLAAGEITESELTLWFADNTTAP